MRTPVVQPREEEKKKQFRVVDLRGDTAIRSVNVTIRPLATFRG